ncbi:hypothetical protein BDC45DRAFT_511726 [Circinella umbellata]|nr:hypothetical protein BDC45DRAFT_511726 [Circinella umbellata]
MTRLLPLRNRYRILSLFFLFFFFATKYGRILPFFYFSVSYFYRRVYMNTHYHLNSPPPQLLIFQGTTIIFNKSNPW